jgi:hypothetical protein
VDLTNAINNGKKFIVTEWFDGEEINTTEYTSYAEAKLAAETIIEAAPSTTDSITIHVDEIDVPVFDVEI